MQLGSVLKDYNTQQKIIICTNKPQHIHCFQKDVDAGVKVGPQ